MLSHRHGDGAPSGCTVSPFARKRADLPHGRAWLDGVYWKNEASFSASTLLDSPWTAMC
ncbi:hypothetical protein ACFPRL_02740 [Pseudoclavibacter helvolus]